MERRADIPVGSLLVYSPPNEAVSPFGQDFGIVIPPSCPLELAVSWALIGVCRYPMDVTDDHVLSWMDGTDVLVGTGTP